MLSCLVWGSPPPSLRWSDLLIHNHDDDDGDYGDGDGVTMVIVMVMVMVMLEGKYNISIHKNI